MIEPIPIPKYPPPRPWMIVGKKIFDERQVVPKIETLFVRDPFPLPKFATVQPKSMRAIRRQMDPDWRPYLPMMRLLERFPAQAPYRLQHPAIRYPVREQGRIRKFRAGLMPLSNQFWRDIKVRSTVGSERRVIRLQRQARTDFAHYVGELELQKELHSRAELFWKARCQAVHSREQHMVVRRRYARIEFEHALRHALVRAVTEKETQLAYLVAAEMTPELRIRHLPYILTKPYIKQREDDVRYFRHHLADMDAFLAQVRRQTTFLAVRNYTGHAGFHDEAGYPSKLATPARWTGASIHHALKPIRAQDSFHFFKKREMLGLTSMRRHLNISWHDSRPVRDRQRADDDFGQANKRKEGILRQFRDDGTAMQDKRAIEGRQAYQRASHTSPKEAGIVRQDFGASMRAGGVENRDKSQIHDRRRAELQRFNKWRETELSARREFLRRMDRHQTAGARDARWAVRDLVEDAVQQLWDDHRLQAKVAKHQSQLTREGFNFTHDPPPHSVLRPDVYGRKGLQKTYRDVVSLKHDYIHKIYSLETGPTFAEMHEQKVKESAKYRKLREKFHDFVVERRQKHRVEYEEELLELRAHHVRKKSRAITDKIRKHEWDVENVAALAAKSDRLAGAAFKANDAARRPDQEPASPLASQPRIAPPPGPATEVAVSHDQRALAGSAIVNAADESGGMAACEQASAQQSQAAVSDSASRLALAKAIGAAATGDVAKSRERDLAFARGSKKRSSA